MKIAIVNGSIRHGGAEHFTVTMANTWIKEFSEEVYLITGEEKTGEYALEADVHRVCVLQEGGSFKGLIRNAKAISRVANKNNIDTIIGIGIYANLCVCLSKMWTKAKVIISERNDPVHDLISWKSRLLRWLLFRYADGMVFQTNEAKSFYSEKIQRKSIVVHNPVTADLPFREDVIKKELVAVGRLEAQKNYDLLIRSFAQVYKKHPEYYLCIFGQGSENEKLQKLTKELQVEANVTFEGFCLNVHERIKHSDIFVMSSDFEGMPNALMEAMAMGFPVVSSDCPSGGPRELIENGVNGVLFKVGEVNDLAEKIVYLIEHPQEKEHIAENAKRIRETHDGKKIIMDWRNFIKSQT